MNKRILKSFQKSWISLQINIFKAEWWQRRISKLTRWNSSGVSENGGPAIGIIFLLFEINAKSEIFKNSDKFVCFQPAEHNGRMLIVVSKHGRVGLPLDRWGHLHCSGLIMLRLTNTAAARNISSTSSTSFYTFLNIRFFRSNNFHRLLLPKRHIVFGHPFCSPFFALRIPHSKN